MKRAVLLLLLFCVLSVGFGQGRKFAIYRTQITTQQGLKVAGVLTDLGDSTLHMIPLNQLRRGRIDPNTIAGTYAVKDIYALRIRKKGAVGRGVLLGGGTGLVLGTILGYASYSPCESSGATGAMFDCFEILDQKNSAIMGGVTGTMAGAGIGMLLGSNSQRILVSGDQQVYRQLKSSLEQYVLKTR